MSRNFIGARVIRGPCSLAANETRSSHWHSGLIIATNRNVCPGRILNELYKMDENCCGLYYCFA